MSSDGSRRRDVTVADVAKAAQVSKAQAARALGNYGAVSEDVRDRVLAAAEELEYRPNELARSMNTGKSNTIGVVVGDIENPHFGLAMRGITDTAKKSGFNVILDQHRRGNGGRSRRRPGASRQAGGRADRGSRVIRGNSSICSRFRDSGRPAGSAGPRRRRASTSRPLRVDMGSISYESTKYLIEAGHRRIAFVSTVRTDAPFVPGMTLDSSQISDRLDGIHRAFDDAGLTQPVDLVRLNAGECRLHHGDHAGATEGPDSATAIIASDGLIALSVVEAIQAAGLSIPEDVSLLMYDDFAWTRLTTPPLTVIAQPVYDMGMAAASALIRQIEGRKSAGGLPPLEARLVRRGSVGSPKDAEVLSQSGG